MVSRIGWTDDVNIDLIRRGLLEEAQKRFDKEEKPKDLFEATNLIISIDKRCYLDQELKTKDKKKTLTIKTFKRKQHELNKSTNKYHYKNKFRKHKEKNEILSNYTPSSNSSMTTTFLIIVNIVKIKINVLIDSGSARSYICNDFIQAHKIPKMNLPTSMNIQLPNQKGMNIKQITKKIDLVIMDHKEKYEFFIANLQLNGISVILG